MSRPVHFSENSILYARDHVSKATTLDELRSAQAVLLAVDHGMDRAEIAALLGVSPATVGRLRSHVRKSEKTPQPRRRFCQSKRNRALMTVDEEKPFLEPWGVQAETAGMIIVGPLQAALAEKLNRKLHSSYVYNLLSRHGWRKVAPDSCHPKGDPDKRDAWKKNSPRWYPKPLPARPPKAKSSA
jgi:transposase